MNNDVINFTETLALCQHNHSLAHELIGMLKTDLPRQKEILLNAFERGDQQMVRDIVHQIIGSCSYISLPQVKHHAALLQAAVHGEGIDLTSLVNNLVNAMNDVIMCNKP